MVTAKSSQGAQKFLLNDMMQHIAKDLLSALKGEQGIETMVQKIVGDRLHSVL